MTFFIKLSKSYRTGSWFGGGGSWIGGAESFFFGRLSQCRVWSSEKKLNNKNGLKRQIFNIALAKKFRLLFKICIKINQKVTVAIKMSKKQVPFWNLNIKVIFSINNISSFGIYLDFFIKHFTKIIRPNPSYIVFNRDDPGEVFNRWAVLPYF